MIEKPFQQFARSVEDRMRDVIQKVIETEEQARRSVARAREEAEQLLAQARRQAQETEARAQQESRAEAEQILREAILAAEQEKQQALAHGAAEIGNQVRLEKAAKQRAVEAAVRCVCGVKPKHFS